MIALTVWQDTHDLFATLVVSLQLDPHRSFFKTYPNSFNSYVGIHPVPHPPRTLLLRSYR
jgi:hypothetical protein